VTEPGVLWEKSVLGLGMKVLILSEAQNVPGLPPDLVDGIEVGGIGEKRELHKVPIKHVGPSHLTHEVETGLI
jgi:hypothetical protein